MQLLKFEDLAAGRQKLIEREGSPLTRHPCGRLRPVKLMAEQAGGQEIMKHSEVIVRDPVAMEMSSS